MAVISGIISAIRIGLTVSRIVYKVGSKTRAGAKWMQRHPKAVRAGTIGATAGGLILDLTNVDYSAILPKKPWKPSKTGQTRNYMEQSQSRRFQRTNYRTRERCPSRFQRQRY